MNIQSSSSEYVQNNHWAAIFRTGNPLKRRLPDVGFEELEGKTFELVLVVEMLCEVCEEPLGKRERSLRKIQTLSREDYQNLLNRATAHDRVEVDVEDGRIYFFDHDFPGDVHPECMGRL